MHIISTAYTAIVIYLPCSSTQMSRRHHIAVTHSAQPEHSFSIIVNIIDPRSSRVAAKVHSHVHTLLDQPTGHLPSTTYNYLILNTLPSKSSTSYLPIYIPPSGFVLFYLSGNICIYHRRSPHLPHTTDASALGGQHLKRNCI